MKKILLVLIFGLLNYYLAHTQKSELPTSRQEAVKTVLQKYVDLGLPGLGITVYTPDTGFWSYSEGYADMEKQIPLSVDHKYYLQSISKTYMAVVILKLYELDQLNLNDPIVKYLNFAWLNSIKGVEKITVKMLLNHTSGLPEYSTNPILISRIIQYPQNLISVPDMLSCLEGKSLLAEPGEKYQYRNTNYAILSLIADNITGDHVAFMNKEVLEKQGLGSTVYLTKSNYKSELNLMEAYWDVLSEGLPANISLLQKTNVASMKGDDGFVATSEDAVRFLRALVENKILKPESLTLMQEWVTGENGEKRYGLGLTYYDLDTTYGIGHSGGGIGAGCVLMYLPELNAYVFLGTNFNTIIDSPIRKKAENLQMEVLLALFS